jgi:hypothetical protein
MKGFAILLLASTVIATIAIAPGATHGTGTPNAAIAAVAAPRETKNVIDGTVHPELIPDNMAYLMLFRLLSNQHTKAQQIRVRSYINQMNLGNADALLAVVNDFERRVGELDQKAQRIHEENGTNPPPNVLAQLHDLKEKKEKIVYDIVASLPDRLGQEGAEKCRRHINERVKRKMKMSYEQEYH